MGFVPQKGISILLQIRDGADVALRGAQEGRDGKRFSNRSMSKERVAYEKIFNDLMKNVFVPPSSQEDEGFSTRGVWVACELFHKACKTRVDCVDALHNHPDPEKVIRVLLEFVDLLNPDVGMQELYSAVSRCSFYMRMMKEEVDSCGGIIVYDEGPEPDIEP